MVVGHNMGHGGAVTWPSVGIFHRHPRPAGLLLEFSTGTQGLLISGGWSSWAVCIFASFSVRLLLMFSPYICG